MRRFLLLTLSMSPVLSLCSPPSMAGPEAEAILLLRKAVEAHGGFQAIGSIRDATFSGTVVAHTTGTAQTYRFVTRTRGFNQVRTETTGPNFLQTYVSDGEIGWVVTNGEKKSLFTHQTSNRVNEINPVLGLLSVFTGNRLQVEYAGLTSSGAGAFHHLIAYLWDQSHERLASGLTLDSRFDVFIDPATYRVASIRFEHVLQDGQPADPFHEYVYYDYRQVAGFLIPFQIEHYRNGRPIKQLFVEDFFLTQHGSIFVEP